MHVGQVPERLHHRVRPVRGERERDEPEPQDADVRAGGVHVHEHPGDEVVDERIALGVDLDRVDLGVRGGEVGGLAEVVHDLDPGRALDRDLVQHLGPGEERVPDLDLDLLLRDHRPEVAPAGDHVDVVEDGQVPAGPGEAREREPVRPRVGQGVEQGLERERGDHRGLVQGPRERGPQEQAGAVRGRRQDERPGGEGAGFHVRPPSGPRSWGRACSRARRPGGSPAGRSPRPPPRTRTRSAGSRPGPTARRGR